MSVIKLTNSVLISQTSIDSQPGVDPANQLMTYNSGAALTWTAPQDCWVGAGGSSIPGIKIDNVEVFPVNGNNMGAYQFPMLRGQVVYMYSNYPNDYLIRARAWGLKKV